MTAKAWQELSPMFKLFSRTIRPWKRLDADSQKGTYQDGWNDCLIAMKKAEATWFRNMDQKSKAKVVPMRPK